MTWVLDTVLASKKERRSKKRGSSFKVVQIFI